VIFTTPAEIPLTIPVVNPTVATAILLLVQLPVGVELVSVIDEPTQWLVGPEIDATTGIGFTVIVRVLLAVPQRLVTE
jgi:hypothetical protein